MLAYFTSMFEISSLYAVSIVHDVLVLRVTNIT